MKYLLRFSFALVLAATMASAQWSYFLTDTTMAGPPSPNWITSNSFSSDMVTASPSPYYGMYGGEVKAVFVSGGFQIYLATYDCYNGCSQNGLSNFTSGYQLGVGANSLSVTSVWVNNFSLQTTTPSSAIIPSLHPGDVIRAICRPDAISGVDIIVYVNNALVLFFSRHERLGTRLWFVRVQFQ